MGTHRIALIKKVPLFAALRGTETEFLAEILREVEVPAGTLFFREGEPGSSLAIIVDGEVEILKALGTPDERLLAVRGPGDFFGEMSLLDPDGLRTASVRTHAPVRLLEMARPDFDALLQQRPALAYEIMRVLSLRLRESDNATIADLHEKNRELTQAYAALQAAQAQIIEKEKLEQELRTAHRIQQSILPGELPRLPGYDFGALIVPTRSVGGDLYDFIPLGRGRMGIAVGDVSDKGVPAAIFMALTRSLLRVEATRVASPRRAPRTRQSTSPGHERRRDVRDPALRHPRRPAGHLCLCRAGHELPLLFDPDGSVRGSRAGRGHLWAYSTTSRSMSRWFRCHLAAPSCSTPTARPTSPDRRGYSSAWIGCRHWRRARWAAGQLRRYVTKSGMG